MTILLHFIVQVDPSERPTLADDRLGVLHPVNMDGFYRDLADAEGVAKYMAEERPDLETYLATAVRKVSQ